MSEDLQEKQMLVREKDKYLKGHRARVQKAVSGLSIIVGIGLAIFSVRSLFFRC